MRGRVAALVLLGLIMLVALALLAATLAAEAQQAGKLPHIGVLHGQSARWGVFHKAFVDELGRLGYVNGRDVVIDDRPNEGTPEAFAAATAALLAAKPDIVVVWSTVGAIAVKKANTSLPVVFVSVGVPVEIGLVASLAHPGGNMTGVTFEAATETYAKRLQLLKEIVPRLSRVAVLHAAGDPNVRHALESLDTAARALDVHLEVVEVRDAGALEAAFSTMTARRVQGVVVVAGSFTFINGQRIARLALTHNLPSSHAFKETVQDGGLVGLAPDYFDMSKQAAAYVSKVLKGAKPADIPVEQPTKYELVINLKTAKALGLTIPPSLMLRADQVIE